nr:DUF6256 family protein [Streptomyces capitiformicae]
MLTGYLLVMGYLALGLLLLRRQSPGPKEAAGKPERRLAKQLAPGATRPGWPGLIRQVLGTAIGGYMLLMAVVVGYYHGGAPGPPLSGKRVHRLRAADRDRPAGVLHRVMAHRATAA